MGKSQRDRACLSLNSLHKASKGGNNRVPVRKKTCVSPGRRLDRQETGSANVCVLCVFMSCPCVLVCVCVCVWRYGYTLEQQISVMVNKKEKLWDVTTL